MADDDKVQDGSEPKVEDKKPDVAPFDANALGVTVANAAQAAVRDALASAAQPAPPVDALEELVAPIVRKHAGGAHLVAELAADKADFYTTEDAEDLALRFHFKDEIEKRAMGLASNRRAMPRLDIYNHLKGEQESKVTEFRQKRRKSREDRARADAEDHGGSGGSREGGFPKSVSVDQAHDLQGSGKLDEFLGDKSF